MNSSSYVLITPVRNEEAAIELTIQSVISQTIPPLEWLIVSDQSTDGTDEIIQRYASEFEFMRLLRLAHRPKRGFASVVFALEAGLANLQARNYDFIGLLDGDVQFGENYYEQILSRFASEPKLGLAGGLVIDCYQGKRHPSKQSAEGVAGAVQFFRRRCFEALGGLIALPEGGWDTITCAQARMHGFKTRTFPELSVDHLKPRNIAEGNVFKRFWQFGLREYAVGNHPLFEAVKCGYRCVEYPFFVGGFMQFGGFLSCYLSRRKRLLSPEILRFRREEQLRRLFAFKRAPVAPLESSGSRIA